MWIKVFAIFCTSQMIIHYNPCSGINFIDLPGFGSDSEKSSNKDAGSSANENTAESSGEANFEEPSNSDDSDTDKREQNKEQTIESSKTTEQDFRRNAYPPVRSTTAPNYRRHWLVSASPPVETTRNIHDDKDDNIKSKISMLVQQTMHDTELRMKSVQKLKESYREDAGYKVGFILSMIKKSRDVLNELFNVAVKHRDEWKALEQLKIFELIVHTNVDTTNLVRQLVEIHIQNLNSTATKSSLRHNKLVADEPSKNRVVLL